MRDGGFTLIELLTYSVILSILLLIAIPSYKIIQDAAFKTDTRNLVTDIRYVKDLTIINGTEYKIIFDKQGYKIVDDKLKELKIYKFKGGTYLEDYELNKGGKKVNYMSYNTSGNASVSGSLIISNTDQSKKRRISIVPVTGRVLLTEL